MSQEEVEVKVKIETGEAVSSVNRLGKSFSTLDNTISKTQEKQKDYGKEVLNSSQLSQKLSQATGGMSDAFMGAIKGIDLTNLSLKGLKGAIMSTGVGILVIALGELISVLADFFSSQKKSEKAVDDLTSSLDRQSESFEQLSETNKFQLDLVQKYAKANGASKEQLKKTNDDYLASEKKRIEEEIALLEKEHKAVLMNDNLNDEDREASLEKVNENIKKLQGLKTKNNRDTLNADAEFYEEQKATQKEATDKANAKKIQDSEKAKADLLQQKNALKTLEQKYEDDIENIQDTTAQKKLDRQKERAIEELNKIKLSESAKLEAVRLINEDFKLKQEALDKVQDDRLLAMATQFQKDKEDLLAKTDEDKLTLKIQRDTLALETELATMVGDDEKKQALRTALDDKNQLLVDELAKKRTEEKNIAKQTELEQTSSNEQLEFQTRLDALIQRDLLIDAQTNLTDAQRIEAKKKNKDLIDGINKQVVASEKVKEEAKYNIARAGIASLTSLTSIMFGEGKKAQAIQKGLTLAQIGIDTASAFSSLMRGSEAAAVATGPAYPISKPLFYASGIVQILANIAKAKQALSGSDSGSAGGSMSAPNIPQAVPVSVNPSIVGDSGINQLANTINQQPIKTYVVASDVTTQQGLDRNIQGTATLG
jgi:hypothetical protein